MAMSTRGEVVVDAAIRRARIADANKLLSQLKSSITKQLVPNKDPKDYTDSDREHIGILNELINNVGKINNIFGIQLLESAKNKLEDNVIYIEYSLEDKKLHYTLISAISEGNKDKFQGTITADELPKLNEIGYGNQLFEFKRIYIHILKALKQNNHIRFSVNDDDINGLNDILKAVFKKRDNEFFLCKMNIDKVVESYFKHKFDNDHPVDKSITEQEQANIKDKKQKYAKAQADKFLRLTSLYQSTFDLYYRISRQLFCLEQFDIIDNSENLIKESDSKIKDIERINTKITDYDNKVKKLEGERKEVKQILNDIIQFLNESNNDVEHVFHGKAYSVDVLKFQLKLKSILRQLIEADVELTELNNRAHSAASGGDELLLIRILADMKDKIKVFSNSRNGLYKIVDDYLNAKITVIADIHSSVDMQSDKFSSASSILDIVYLTEVAAQMKNQDEKGEEFSYMALSLQELRIAKLEDSLINNVEIFINNLRKFIAFYLRNQEVVERQEKLSEACNSFLNSKQLQFDILKECNGVNDDKDISEGDNLSANFANMKLQWEESKSVINKRFNVEHYAASLSLMPNNILAFLRRHWWKMLICSALLVAIATPISIFLFSLVASSVALITVSAIIAGIFMGAGIGAVTDKFCPLKLDVPGFDDEGDTNEVIIGTTNNKDEPYSVSVYNASDLTTPIKPSGKDWVSSTSSTPIRRSGAGLTSSASSSLTKRSEEDWASSASSTPIRRSGAGLTSSASSTPLPADTYLSYRFDGYERPQTPHARNPFVDEGRRVSAPPSTNPFDIDEPFNKISEAFNSVDTSVIDAYTPPSSPSNFNIPGSQGMRGGSPSPRMFKEVDNRSVEVDQSQLTDQFVPKI